jgi:hypothetical protein
LFLFDTLPEVDPKMPDRQQYVVNQPLDRVVSAPVSHLDLRRLWLRLWPAQQPVLATVERKVCQVPPQSAIQHVSLALGTLAGESAQFGAFQHQLQSAFSPVAPNVLSAHANAGNAQELHFGQAKNDACYHHSNSFAVRYT